VTGRLIEGDWLGVATSGEEPADGRRVLFS
jgi:hypothetical protein